MDLCKKVSQALQKALSADSKVVVLCGDCDNLGASAVIQYLIEY